MQSYPEGTVADGPNGPIVFHRGQWVSAGRASPVIFAPADPSKGPKDAAETARAQAEADPVLLKAQRDRAIAEAAKAQADAATAGAGDIDPTALASLRAGKQIKLTDLPADARGIVSGLLQGNLPPGTRSIAAKTMLPYIKMAMSVDPSFSANTFTARQKATSQLADMKATGGYLTSLAANIDHSREEEAAINALDNPGGLYGRFGGAALHNWLYNKNGPAGAAFDQANRVYSGEQVKSITGNVGTAGGGSALADRQDARDAITASMPIDAQRAALRVGAIQNYQKWQDANASYRRTMGTDIPDALSPEQAAQLLHLMRLQGDGSEGPIPDGVDHSFIALALGHTGGDSGGDQGGGNGAPPAFSGPPPITGNTPPSGGRGQIGPQSNPYNYVRGEYGDGTATEVAGATKSIPNELGIRFMKGFNALVHSGASPERLRGYASQFGVNVDDQLNFLKTHPGFSGSFPSVPGGLSITIPNDSAMSRIAGAMASDPTGITPFVGAAGNSAAAGIPQWAAASLSDNPDLARARFNVARSMSPGATSTGDLVGGTLGFVGGESAALKGAGMLGRAANLGERGQGILNFGGRRVADAAFGGISGATGAEPGQSGNGALKGAIAGTVGGLMGEGAGRYILEPATRPVGRLFGAPMAPSAADNALFRAVGNNAPDITAQLSEAQGLNLPMTLADTNPALRSLTGAAVRRSPNASGIAENVLIPRNRGQIDRFGAALNRDLGPIGNVPQISQDLQTAARTNAGPLYDQAYTAPQINDPELTALLNNPQMRPAVDAAQMFREQDATLAAARGMPAPPPLADPNAPDIRTLDYIKRGLDGKIRTAFTGGDPQAAMSGPFYKDARNILLNKADTAVPDYAQARLAYGGPMRAMDALEAGQNAAMPGMTADQLGVDLGNIGPGDWPQIQLGHRSGLMDQANNLRMSGNPFDATLGTPNAVAKLQAINPDNPNVARLLRQRDLEAQMQATSNDILGNSKTAQRGIADQDFMDKASWAPTAIDAAVSMKSGSLPIGPIAKLARAVADTRQVGLGRQRADILAPTLLNPDPAAASSELTDILARSKSYRDYLARRRGMFGAPMGAVGSGLITGYSASQ